MKDDDTVKLICPRMFSLESRCYFLTWRRLTLLSLLKQSVS